jgi:sulfate transport system substrate-binding protein
MNASSHPGAVRPTGLFYAALVALLLCGAAPAWADTTLTNASYTATKEMFAAYNPAFARYWKAKTGEAVVITQSHANSSTQASLVNNGLAADVVTLSVPLDVDEIASNHLVSEGWKQRLPQSSTPYYSTIVFLVHKGNPKAIKDWPDLVRWGVRVVMSNPKSSGGARWSHLAAWGYALKKPGGTEASAREFLKRLYNNKVLEYTARGASNTFVNLKQGDVMVSWENEAFQIVAQYPELFQIVVPSVSVVAEPPVAVIDKVVDQRGSRKVAEAYLQYLYCAEGQSIAASHFYRPSDPGVASQFEKQFTPLKLFKVGELYKDWQTIDRVHFQDGGIFDQVYDQYRNGS